ncbi:molybdopterin-dependent oxidoreductase [Nocardioides sp. CPCC 205120]|uniref:molybdopterin-dependent oxidoreductase n=1 Tax=Nocardioides sp. CPCC 205120 TaxID=3406462 RepID=UPI003B50DF8F
MEERTRVAWAGSGLVAALLGFGVSELAAGALTLHTGPLLGVREAVQRLLPSEYVVHNGIDLVAIATGPLLTLLVALVVAGLALSSGIAAARGWRRPAVVAAGVGAVGAALTLVRPDAGLLDLLPVAAGVLGYGATLLGLAIALRRDAGRAGTDPAPAVPDGPAVRRLAVLTGRRGFLAAAGAVAVVGVVLAVTGEVVGRGRRAVEEGRRLLRLTMVTEPRVPAGADVGVIGVRPWQTPNDDFYRVDSAIVVPTTAAEDWTLRIHGEVEREVVVGYAELIAMTTREQWTTLVGLTNEVGGNRVGNAWWSGVPTSALLERAGVLPGADAVVQTGADGWRCVTTTQVLGDPGRSALLAFGMNGEPLPLDHGFPVRTLVPGLYGGVAACKWVVDWEVTRLDVVGPTWDADRPLTAPVRLSSRIEVPADGAEVPPGVVDVAGTAWAPPAGVEAVEVAVDDGDWQRAVLGDVRLDDAWAQWRAAVELEAGTHRVRVRVRDRLGGVQESAVVDDGAGATGLHEVTVEVVAPEA